VLIAVEAVHGTWVSLTMTTFASAVCCVAYYQLRQLHLLIRSLSLMLQVDSPSVHFNTPGLLQLTTVRDQRQPVSMPTSHSKCCSMPHHQHEKVRANHAHPAAATLSSSPPTCSIQRRCAVLVYKALHNLLPAYLWKTANLCLSLDTDDCVRRTPTRA